LTHENPVEHWLSEVQLLETRLHAPLTHEYPVEHWLSEVQLLETVVQVPFTHVFPVAHSVSAQHPPMLTHVFVEAQHFCVSASHATLPQTVPVSTHFPSVHV
jgi:hypothetical protein